MDKESPNREMTAPDRWYLDPGAIPGEPAYYLDVPPVPDDDLDKAAGIVSEVDGKGFEAVAVINGDNHHLGRFKSVGQAKHAVDQAQADYETGIIRQASKLRPN